jgi:hypothetical protein
MNSPCSAAQWGRGCRLSRRLVILADEVEWGRIRIHPALQAAGNSNLKVIIQSIQGFKFANCGEFELKIHNSEHTRLQVRKLTLDVINVIRYYLPL